MGVIYALFDPESPDHIRYVGKTVKSAEARLKGHLQPCKLKEVSYKNNWINSLLGAGKAPGVRIIEELDDASKLSSREIYWISELKLRGHQLTNLTDGGDGNCGWSPSPAMRKKMSEVKLGKSHSTEHRRKNSEARLGKPHSAEHRRRISESLKKRYADPVSRNRGRSFSGKNNPMYGRVGELNPMYGKTHSEATRKKISAALIGKPGLSTSRLGKSHSEGAKQKIREAAIRREAAKREAKLNELNI